MCMYVYIGIYIYIYIYMYVCVYVWMWVCMWVHICMSFFGGFTVINRLVLLPRTAGLPLEVTAYFLGSRPDAECC